MYFSRMNSSIGIQYAAAVISTIVVCWATVSFVRTTISVGVIAAAPEILLLSAACLSANAIMNASARYQGI